jgi:hypothetical protein
MPFPSEYIMIDTEGLLSLFSFLLIVVVHRTSHRRKGASSRIIDAVWFGYVVHQ